MHTRHKARQRGAIVQKVFVSFCLLLLFACLGTVLFVTSKTHAQDATQRPARDHVMQPTDLSPTIVPTIAPTIAPTNAPTVAPTIAPTAAPTIAPTAPKTVPTPAPPVISTATSVAGVPPPVGNPTTQPTAIPMVSPTATAKETATPSTAKPTPVATNSVSSSVTNPNSSSITIQQDATKTFTGGATKTFTILQVALIIGAAIIIGTVLSLGLVWQQQRANDAAQIDAQQQATPFQQQGKVVTEPLYQEPQPMVLHTIQEALPLPVIPYSTSHTQYAQPTQVAANQSLIREQKLSYQENSPTMQVAETPILPQKTTSEADSLLESMMRQAQMGIFALPDKTE